MITLILKAVTPEEVFKIVTLDSIGDAYKALCKQVHPDLNKSPDAAAAQARLTLIYELAQERLKTGEYGKNLPIDPKPRVEITVGKSVYSLSDSVKGDLSTVYRSGDFVVKIVNSPADNDLLQSEAVVLREVEKHALARSFITTLVDSSEIKYSGRRRVNIFKRIEGFTLREVHNRYPNLDLRHAAWMWRRLLAALAVVHGAVTLDNFMIVPSNHQGILLDFTGAVKFDGKNKAKLLFDNSPPEVTLKHHVGPWSDVYMAAKVFEQLIGETPVSGRIKALIRACTLKTGRLDGAFQIHEDFGFALEQIYGKPKFVDFTMQ